MIKVNEYKKGIINKVIDIKAFFNANKNYKTTTKNDTLNKMIERFLNVLKSKKITNEDLNKFDYFTNLFVVNNDDKQKINNIDKFTLKTMIIKIYNETKKLGVIKTQNDNIITYEMGLKSASVFKTMQSMYILLLSEKLTQTKPPKKEKAKKTIKK